MSFIEGYAKMNFFDSIKISGLLIIFSGTVFCMEQSPQQRAEYIVQFFNIPAGHACIDIVADPASRKKFLGDWRPSVNIVKFLKPISFLVLDALLIKNKKFFFEEKIQRRLIDRLVQTSDMLEGEVTGQQGPDLFQRLISLVSNTDLPAGMSEQEFQEFKELNFQSFYIGLIFFVGLLLPEVGKQFSHEEISQILQSCYQFIEIEMGPEGVESRREDLRACRGSRDGDCSVQ